MQDLFQSLAPLRAIAGPAGRWVIANGVLVPGANVAVLPSARLTTVDAIFRNGAAVSEARPGDLVTLNLRDGSLSKPGDVLSLSNDRPQISDQLAAKIDWIGEEPLFPGRAYDFVAGDQTTTASISQLKYKIDPRTAEHIAARQLEFGESGMCNLALSDAIVFDPFPTCPETGFFYLTDSGSGARVGFGRIHFGLRRAENVHWQALTINKPARAEAKQQQPCCLWFTGLSGSGKSTIANLVERRLHSTGRHTYILDGDNVRHGLNRDLGFTDADRVENIRRVAEVAKLMVDAGLIVLVSFISPFRAERALARGLFEPGEFLEVFVETPIELCEQRDPKGLYAKARKGLIRNFTGIDSVYEAPDAPDVRLETARAEPADLAELLLADLARRGIVS